jgi:hypothetical protein
MIMSNNVITAFQGNVYMLLCYGIFARLILIGRVGKFTKVRHAAQAEISVEGLGMCGKGIA